MTVSSSVISGRNVTAFSAGEEIQNSSSLISNDKNEYGLNIYLSSGETLFAGEKAQVTIDYTVTGSGLTVTHNGQAFDITGGTSKTFDTFVTCYSGAFDCENAVFYGTDDPHIALSFSLNAFSYVTITGL